MSNDDATGTEAGAAAPQRDASLRVDTKALSSEEQDFARMMGFAGDENPAAATPLTPSAPTETLPATAAAIAPPAQAPSPPAREWEEIHPRAAALGRQSALVERADRVLKLEPDATSERAFRDAVATRPTEPDVPADRAVLARSGQPANPESEKEIDVLRNELDVVLQERDRLGDELAIANAARAQAQTRAERFETALRAARGPDGPLPDGERDLRAEVIGLRRRLEEASSETRRLREDLDIRATDLAIAHAHRDDRQQEIDQHKERIAALEQDRTAQVERLDEALARQRELLALASRVQAENVELRSAQAALEETLEARDLEINAREEHLQVTRRGLSARDQQLLDAEGRLEQERHRHGSLEAERDRARRANAELEAKLARRDARIASLATTLTRIEQAIGRPAPSPEIAAGERAAALEPARPDDRESVPRAPVQTAASPALQTFPSPAPAALAPILAAWRDSQLRSICGAAAAPSLHAFLAKRLCDHFAAAPPAALRITSLAGAHADAEIALVRALAALGAGPSSVRVLECSGEAAAARREAIEAAGLSATISVELWEGLQTPSGELAHALFVSDALFGQPQSDRLLAQLANGLVDQGVLLFVDRIAGGAVELSQESREKLAELWQVLPESWTEQAAFAAPPAAGDDGGTAAPAVDPVAMLCERFVPIVTVGFGHIADLFVGPARGFALSQAGHTAEPLLTSIDAIDESRSIHESLPPRHGVAVCVRRADANGLAPPPRESLGLAWPGMGC